MRRSPRRRADVLSGAATFALDDALRFSPTAWHVKLMPNLGLSTFQQVDPVRIVRECQLEGVVGVVAVTVLVDQSVEGLFDPFALSAARIEGCGRWQSIWQ